MNDLAAAIEKPGLQKLWNADYIKIFVLSLIYGISTQMLLVTLPPYVLSLGGSPTDVGIMVAAMSILALIIRPFAGYVLDNRGRKISMLFGLIVFCAGTVVFPLVSAVGIIIAFRIIQGIGVSFTTTAAGTIAADVSPPDQMAEGIAYFGLANTMGTAVGPAIGMTLISSSGYEAMFLSSIIIGVAAIALGFFINYEKKRGLLFKRVRASLPSQKGHKENILLKIFEKAAIMPSIVMVLISTAMAIVLSFLVVYAQSLGIENTGIFFSVAAVTMLVVRVLTGRLLNKINTMLLLVPSIIIYCIGFFMLSVVNSFAGLLFCAVLYGVGIGSPMPILNAMALHRAPINRRGAANATFFASFDIGIGLGTLMWGIFIDAFGYCLMFVAGGFVGLCALFLSFALPKKSRLNMPRDEE